MESKNLKKFVEIKDEYKDDSIVLIRGNEKYEVYGKDAPKVAEICGFDSFILDIYGIYMPYTQFTLHSLDTYLPRIIRAGFKVRIVDIED